MVNLHRKDFHFILICLISVSQTVRSENPDSKVLSKNVSESIMFPDLGSKVDLYFYFYKSISQLTRGFLEGKHRSSLCFCLAHNALPKYLKSKQIALQG